MITEICGIPRAGKTALMTSLAMQHMTGIQAHRDLKQCRKLLAPLLAGGFGYAPPDDHLVFADYTIQTHRGRVTNYECDGFYLGLAQDTHPTMFLPPASHVYLDEAQKYYNSREGASKLADFVSRFYELHGHYRLNITLTVQRPMLIDKNIRELAGEVLYVRKLEHEKQGGRIVRSVWDCYRFDSSAAAVAYIDSGFDRQAAGERVQFEYVGNIFRHYDSYAFFPAFLRDRYDSAFDLRHAVVCSYTRAGIMDFNDQHDYSVPETYFKGGKKKV